MKRPSDLKADIEKIKKLKALQQKATDKLDKIADDSAAKVSKKKAAVPKKSAVKMKPAIKAKPAPKRKAKSPAKKKSLWQKLFGGKKGRRKKK